MEQEKDDCLKSAMEDICSSLPALSVEEELNQIKLSNMKIDESKFYSSKCRYQGLVIIFNHTSFEPELMKEKREYSDVDCEALINCFQTLRFKCELYHDMKKSEINNKLQEVKRDKSLKEYDAFAVVVLSHGDKNVIFAKDAPYFPDTLLSPFSDSSCPSLAGKPKLFFIQACRGRKSDPGYDLNNPETVSITNPVGKVFLPPDYDNYDNDCTLFSADLQKDFLVMFATMPGHYAFKNNRGSWFIRSLCEELLEKSACLHLLQILNFVCQKVAFTYLSRNVADPSIHKKKQIPCVLNGLSKLLFFRRAVPVDPKQGSQLNPMKMSGPAGLCCSFI